MKPFTQAQERILLALAIFGLVVPNGVFLDLAFDLLVGVWEARDAATRVGSPHGRLVPCLLLTFLFGPAGWLSCLAVRRIPLPARSPAPPGLA